MEEEEGEGLGGGGGGVSRGGCGGGGGRLSSRPPHSANVSPLPVHYERINTRHSNLIGLRLRDRGVVAPPAAQRGPAKPPDGARALALLTMTASLRRCRPFLRTAARRGWHRGGMPNRESGGRGRVAKRLLACKEGWKGQGGGGALPGTISSHRPGWRVHEVTLHDH